MAKFILELALTAAGLAVAMPLGILAMRQIWRSNPKGAMAAASALMLLLSPAYQDMRGKDLIEETDVETKRKKASQSGDPPSLGEDLTS